MFLDASSKDEIDDSTDFEHIYSGFDLDEWYVFFLALYRK